jgi:hypothetical protein
VPRRGSGKLVKHYKWFYLDRRSKAMVKIAINRHKKLIMIRKIHEKAEG